MVNEMAAEASGLAVQIDELGVSKENACSGVACTVDSVEGETRVSTLLIRLAETPLTALTGKDLKARLRRTDGATRLLFTGATGSFA